MTKYSVTIEKTGVPSEAKTNKFIETTKNEGVGLSQNFYKKGDFTKILSENNFLTETVPRDLRFNRKDDLYLIENFNADYIGGRVTRQDALVHWWKFNEIPNTGTNDPRTPMDSQTDFSESWNLINEPYGTRYPIISSGGKEDNYTKPNTYRCYYKYTPTAPGTFPFSYSCWLKAPSVPWYSGQAKSFTNFSYLGMGTYMAVWSGEAIGIQVSLASGGAFMVTTPAITDTNWHLLVVAADQVGVEPTKGVNIYWDNVLRWSYNSATLSSGGTGDIRIGYNSFYAVYEQIGMDDLRIYNTKLTVNEADEIWNQGYGDWPWVNFLSAWGYKRTITIDNTSNSNELPYYQIPVTINTQELILAGKMKADGSDIRFTQYHSNKLLNYWIEGPMNSTSTKIWVKVPKIIASDTTRIELYYGNSAATAVADGFKTFEIFDDFESGTTSRWTATRGAVRTVYDTEFGSTALRVAGSPIGSNDYVKSNAYTTEWTEKGFVIEFKAKWQSFGTYGARLHAGLAYNPSHTESGQVNVMRIFWERGGGLNNNRIYGNGFVSYTYNTQDWTTLTVYPHVLRRTSPELWVSRDGGSSMFLNHTNGSATTVSGNLQVYFTAWDTNQDVRIDNVRVRKLAQPEPAITIGSETPN